MNMPRNPKCLINPGFQASLIVWAINEGREVAREVDRYLMGSSVLP